MRFRDITASFLALSLATTPVLAQTASADVSRTSAPVSEANEMGGGTEIIALIGAVVWGLFIFLVIDDDNSDSP
jgi:hypothetical protein